MARPTDRLRRICRGGGLTVVGVGHTARGDDAVGSVLASELGATLGALPLPEPDTPASTLPADFRVVNAGNVPENFLGPLIGPGRHAVLFLDAAELGSPPGTWCIEPARKLAARDGSSHAPSLRLLAGLLEAHGVRAWVLGIQPRRTSPGSPLSEPVRAAVSHLRDLLAHELAGVPLPHPVHDHPAARGPEGAPSPAGTPAGRRRPRPEVHA